MTILQPRRQDLQENSYQGVKVEGNLLEKLQIVDLQIYEFDVLILEK